MGKTAQQLLERLDQIGQSLAASGKARALFGLGSVGVETSRIDAYSDLDFFVIAQPGRKAELIANLDWLSAIRPLAFQFQNTVDGHKAMFDDGIFCEFAVFELDELPQIFYSPGRMVWATPDIDPAIVNPTRLPEPEPQRDNAWLVAEALGNLYVGLCRYRRGEKLSGFRFVQVDAVNRVMQLAARLEAATTALRDIYAHERRFEARYPSAAADLPPLMQGYDATPASALATLAWLEQRFDVNALMSRTIKALAA